MSDIRLSEDASQPTFVAPKPCVKIDKGVPMPPKYVGVGRPTGEGKIATAANSMLVGDSFVYPADGRDLATVQRRASAWVAWWKSPQKVHLGKLFECRSVTENGERVVRVWRVA